MIHTSVTHCGCEIQIGVMVKPVKKVSNLSIIVEVWIESNAVMTRCLKVDVHWRLRIVLRKIHIKLETPIGVWSV